jgi:uncharacterized damage-inducible protein DinB
MRFMGRPVVVHTRDGAIHHGILHSVTGDGIYMRPFGGGTTRFASATDVNTANINLLQSMPQPEDDVEEAFFPFLFLPFLALAALGPWGWW